MDRMFFKLIDQLVDCQSLANHLAMNANYDSQYGELVKDELPILYKHAHVLEQCLFNAVRRQTACEPTIKEICVTRQS